MKRFPLLPGVLGAGALFALYAATLCPDVFLGDSGELTAAALRLDIPHPPGYPLYALAGRIASLLPVGSVAFRLNLLSAAAGAAAFLLLYRTARLLAGPVPSLLAAAFFGAAPLVWSQCVIAEVYAPAALLLVAALHPLLRARNRRDVLLGGFLAGLAAAAHPTGALLLPLLPAAGLAARRRAGTGSVLRAAAEPLLAAAGALTLFLYLPVRSALDPPVDWGDPEGAAAFLAHVFRLQYGDAVLADPGIGAWAERITAAAGRLARDGFPAVLAPLVLLGAAGSFIRKSKGTALRLAAALLAGPVLVAALRFPLAPDRVEENLVFLIPFLAILSLWLAEGIGLLARALPGATLRKAGALLLAAFLLFRIVEELPRMRFDRVRLPGELARQVLASLPPGASLIAEGDDIVFPLLYLRAAENLRPDLGIHQREGAIFPPPPAAGAAPPVYFTFPAPGAAPDWPLWRPPGSPPVRSSAAPPLPGAERGPMASSAPLRALWINHLETASLSAARIDEAAAFRKAAIAVEGKLRFADGGAALLYARAAALIDRGRMGEAEETLRPAAGTRPEDGAPTVLLTELLLRRGAIDEARALLAGLSDDAPAEALRRAAAALLWTGDREEARRLLERAAEADPLSAEGWAALAEIEAEAGEAERAERHARRARLIDPRTGEENR